MKVNFYKLIVIFSILFSICTLSCTKKEEVVEVVQPKWTPVENHIAVLFGYGYNDKPFVDSICSVLADEYGLEENDGLILPLVYPQDFIVTGSVARISNLSSIIKEKNCKSLITLGAPEFTHRALAKIQDDNISCTVVSLFSQDDILGTESGSFLVFDFAEKELVLSEESEELVTNQSSSTDLHSLTKDTELQHLDKMNFILEKTINLLKNPSELQNKEISQIATGIFGKDWEVSSFLDSDTGLRSRNHFVLKYIEPIVIPEPEEETVKKWYEKFIIK